MVDPIRLSSDASKRRIAKQVTVEVEIRPEELAQTLTREEVVRLCARHGIELKRNGGRGGSRHKLARVDLLAVQVDLSSGAIPDALIKLERLLPSDFRHLSEDVERFYRRRS